MAWPAWIVLDSHSLIDVEGNDALGKILRINPLLSGSNSYSIPASNPFVGNASLPDEVYSLGHRNPHHLAFLPSGDLLVTEAGHDNIEEINLINKGANYGWSTREGAFVRILSVGLADIRIGQGTFGEMYLMNKRNNVIYLVRNSYPPERAIPPTPTIVEAAVPTDTRVDFDITVPTYMSDELQIRVVWGDKDLTAGWVVDETWAVSDVFPADTENTLQVSFNDRNNQSSARKDGAILVIPFDPENSYLLQKMEGADGIIGRAMSYGLDRNQIVRDWIAGGALND